jgi:AcrR family transcriptional regulator
MPNHPPPPTTDTHQRLLDAAARVFARDGLSGATTRAIAEEAGVNEVTLFRHFQTKDRLITAVVGENFGAAAVAAQAPLPAMSTDLRADLTALARHYAKVLTDNLPLVRTMIGEIHHQLHCTNEKLVFKAIFLFLKDAVRTRVDTAQRAGQVRPDMRPDLLADLFFGMVFTDVLRRSSPQAKIDYTAGTYLDSAVSLFLNGVAVPKQL